MTLEKLTYHVELGDRTIELSIQDSPPTNIVHPQYLQITTKLVGKKGYEYVRHIFPPGDIKEAYELARKELDKEYDAFLRQY